jgi:protein-S-isoprenylcysteine O-methyltransferase Ste14
LSARREIPSISRVILPPYWFFAFLLLQAALDAYLPLVRFTSPAMRYFGWALLAAAMSIGGSAIFLFQRTKTGIVPFSPSSSLVKKGPYRITRNPMYLGMTVALVGWALILRSLAPFFLPPVFVALMTYLFVLPEEGHLEKTFGAPYLDFKTRTRRWL